MATIVRYVNPAATDGGNGTTTSTDPEDANRAYCSLADWEGHEQTNLDTANNIMQVNCAGTTADTTACTITGWTTSATDYIEIIGDYVPPASGNWYLTTQYRLEVSNATTIDIQEEYVRIHNIQIQITVTTTGRGINVSSVVAGGSDVRIYNCIIKGVCSGTGLVRGLQCNDADLTNFRIWNCVVYDMVSGTDVDFYGIYAGFGVTVDIANCLIHNCRYGIIRSNGTVNVYNTIVFDNFDDFNGTFNTITYCASDDNDVTGGGTNIDETAGGKTWSDAFVDYTTDDFRLKAGSLMIDAGTADPLGLAGLGYALTDIEGDTRSTWDIGADEYVAALFAGTYPIEEGTPAYQTLLHQFEDKNTNNTDQIALSCNGQSTVAPLTSTVYLQIYNRTKKNWETVATNDTSAVSTDFTLTKTITTGLTDYYSADFWISCRVMQEVK